MRPSLSTTGVKFRLTPNFLNAIEGWQVVGAPGVLDVGGAGKAVEDGKFAAGHEGRGFSGNRGQVRLGERVNHAGLLHRLQRGGDRFASRR